MLKFIIKIKFGSFHDNNGRMDHTNYIIKTSSNQQKSIKIEKRNDVGQTDLRVSSILNFQQ